MSYKDPTIQFFGKLKLENIKAAKVPRFCDDDAPQGTKVTASKRAQMEGLLTKEKDREKKERVVSVLMNKLVSKFGVKYSQLINFFVEEFLTSHSEIVPSELNMLEREINNAIMTSIESSKVPQTNDTTDPVAKPPSRKNSNAIQEPPPGSEWQVIQAYQAIKAEEAENKKQELMRKKRESIKKSLDEQIYQAHNKGNGGAVAEKEFATKVYQDVDKYHEEEKLKKLALIKKGDRITESRNKQIEENAARHKAEKDELDRMERLNIQLAKESLERENLKMQNMRKKSQEMQKKILLDNEEKLKNDELRKLQDAEDEKRRQRQYADKLEADQVKKDAALESKFKAMAAFGAKYESEGAGKAIREQKIKEEQFLLNEQRKKAAADDAREQKKIDDRRIASEKALKENSRQMEAKKKKVEDEHQADIDLALKYKENAIKNKIEDDEKHRNLKAKQSNYRDTLNAQMTARAGADTNLTGLSEIERQLNLSTMRAALADPQVASKILAKVNVKGGTAPVKKH